MSNPITIAKTFSSDPHTDENIAQPVTRTQAQYFFNLVEKENIGTVLHNKGESDGFLMKHNIKGLYHIKYNGDFELSDKVTDAMINAIGKNNVAFHLDLMINRINKDLKRAKEIITMENMHGTEKAKNLLFAASRLTLDEYLSEAQRAYRLK